MKNANAAARTSAAVFILKLAVLSMALTAAAILLNYIYRSCFLSDINGRATSADGAQGRFAGGVYSVISDAGHGGRDGGALSVTGTPEKTLNLEISLTFSELLRAVGINAIETRTEDTAVGGEAPRGSQKMSDLKGRLEISQASPGVPFISIHMNKFPQSQYNGLQVWYSKNNDRSKELAEVIRRDTVLLLQPNNNRAIKPSGNNIFLLDRIESPAVTVECGFISNPQEAAALETKKYRDALSAVLTGSVVRYFTGTGDGKTLP